MSQGSGFAWPRHIIDDSYKGADGVRLGDVDGDGDIDLVVGWEESGVVTVHLNPDPSSVDARWPAVLVGRAGAVEDAVFVDLDDDGALDVVSSCEGDVRSMYVHWAPADQARVPVSSAWRTEPLPAARNARKWMFCVPMQVDGRNGVDLVAGAKGDNAQIGWFESPVDPRDLAAWRYHPIADAAWIMSLIPIDLDGDGDLDLVASDRKGRARGCYWFENPGPGLGLLFPWPRQRIGDEPAGEVMFMDLADVEGDGLLDALAAISGKQIMLYRRQAADPPSWNTTPISLPDEVGNGKGVRAADIDLDGRLDVVFSCEGAGEKVGVGWLAYRWAVTDRNWRMNPISDSRGAKFDLLQVLDLDGDGDLDVVTTEEKAGLGVIRYENPTR